jgi:PEP-CTERM motif
LFNFWEKYMKFQVKALVAALAVVASAQAQAAIDAATTGSSSMLLTVFDRAANVSATFDLGKNYADFSIIGSSFTDSNVDALGTSFSWNLTAGDYATAWSSFLPLVNPANLQWSVIGGDNIGSGAGSRGVIATLGQETVAPLATNPLIAQLGSLGSYIQDAPFNGIYENHSVVANGANVSNAGVTTNFVNFYAGGKPNGAGSVTVAGINSSMGVYQQVSGSSAFGASTSAIFANNAAFRLTSNGTLTYSTDPLVTPVPEADSWAMMLLGLGFMGFAARRKQA